MASRRPLPAVPRMMAGPLSARPASSEPRPLPLVPRMLVGPLSARSPSSGPRHGGGSFPAATAPAVFRRPKLPEGVVRIAVLTSRTGRIELEVPHDEPVEGIRRRLAELGEVRGHPADLFPAAAAAAEADARLLFHGIPLKLDRPLDEQGAGDGAVLRLLPGLRESRAAHVKTARRGLLMTPGNRPWAPGLARGPREPLLYEANAPYGANLVHRELLPHPALPQPA
uniref:Ubiquitin-like domain-containing protein n=1 Tax=Alexandrium catenella TaxID=2925 RepID=A0A7S1RHY5_ALECA